MASATVAMAAAPSLSSTSSSSRLLDEAPSGSCRANIPLTVHPPASCSVLLKARAAGDGRWLTKVGGFHANKRCDSWWQYGRVINQFMVATLLEKHDHITCFRDRRLHRRHAKKKLLRRALSEGVRLSNKSWFPFGKLPARPKLVESSDVQCGAVGPDEPHVTTTSWAEDVVLEKQGLGYWGPQMSAAEFEGFLNSQLPCHPKLYRGQLKNGLQYLILPNKVPANRFEAHMEVHVGSIDEEEDEQGIAHMIEHVAFLGSKKREKLLGTGARSNAYTDFHHTVFHIHSPTSTKDSEGDLLPFVLDALNEIAFHPKFLSSRVEKERRAILSELQMMNTIEYRVDCQLLLHLHSENKLSKRFPIGLEEQIKKWDVEKIRSFHERWYFPANANLYIVGDIESVSKTIYQIEAVFGRTTPENEAPSSPAPSAFGAMASFLVPKLSGGLVGNLYNERTSSSPDQAKHERRARHITRPPVEHNWSLPGSCQSVQPPQIFQHELLQNFSINLFCKIPVNKVRTYGDLRNVLMKRIFLSALHFRINTRYKSSNPPFTSIELDHSDSGREGCTVTTLTVSAEPRNWQSAVKVAVQEVRRLKVFGVTKGELARYMDALLKDSEQLAAMIDNVPSVDNLDFIMESDALGHTVMDQRQGHESLVSVAETVTLEEVNAVGATMLEYISDFGSHTAPPPAAIVACVPKTVHVDGVDEVEFRIDPAEITEAINAGLKEPIEAEAELDVPKELISLTQLKELVMLHKPSFSHLCSKLSSPMVFDAETGITQLQLSNGIPVNYKITQNEAKGGVMRLIVGGGRANETPDSRGSVIVGVRTLSEGGRVGNFSREQVELFCVNHLINCSLESTEEFICMEFRFTLRDGGMRAAFQLLHMVLEHNVWLEDAFDRARQLYLSYYRAIPKSLERATAHKLMTAMLDGDERFVEPTPQSLQKLTLPLVRDAVMDQFVGDNMEVFLKDTDERACAYLAGPAPNRWGFTNDGRYLFQSIDDLYVYKAVDACKSVLRGLHSNKITQRELDRAIALYLDSTLDLATVICFLLRHETKFPLRKNRTLLGILCMLTCFQPNIYVCYNKSKTYLGCTSGCMPPGGISPGECTYRDARKCPIMVQPVEQGCGYRHVTGRGLLSTPTHIGQQGTSRGACMPTCFLCNKWGYIKANYWFNP
ncbi:unnamed protein product [Victoria cruziana]